ncbi:DUF4077 domain-containing protein [Paenibacillus sabinae]|uniref:LuxR family two component transcriptional regulator n=1 Tax=Paenibacillus sabinae T27 TaxID=1268072 RepID=X4ZE50_9BACL|nr:DUF4077 domain-containing protein [Paenibacillus sabinae]AHV95747.1 LuxR family two component transcriptional regulator [Paenibacillus sabinae T27]
MAVRWIKEKCFTHLELESQKNHLMLLLSLFLFILGELNISTNFSLLDSINLKFAAADLTFIGITFVFLLFPRLEKAVKYEVMLGMLFLVMYEIYIFNDYPIVYQLVYINLALSLIYLDGTLILITGIATAIATALGFIFWKNAFFPHIESNQANAPIIFVLQTTLVLWGVTQIGKRFYHFIDHNKEMQELLHENNSQLHLISEQNKALTDYAKQVEKLTILEERNRISQELHDTIGHTLTSLIAGMELVKAQAGEDHSKRMDNLLHTARQGLEDIRDHVHQTNKTSSLEPLEAQMERLAKELSDNTGTAVQFGTAGERIELPVRHQLVLLRCAQEAMTNAIRHGQADAIQVRLSYEPNQIGLEISDNGSGISSGDVPYGFGLGTMKERIESLHGTLQVSSGFGQGVRLICTLPIKGGLKDTVIRLLIAEDQELIAESFSLLLGMEPDLQVAGIAGNGEAAIELCEREAPDLILMDIHMPKMNGIEATRVIKERWPQVHVMMLTTFQDVEHASEAIALGADGYFLKSVQPKHLAEAIRIVCGGGTLITMETAKLLVKELREGLPQETGSPESPASKRKPAKADEAGAVYSLTGKELEIIRYLSDGLKYKDIALKMHFSESTIKNYVSIIYSKLNVENRIQAVKLAQEKLLL